MAQYSVKVHQAKEPSINSAYSASSGAYDSSSSGNSTPRSRSPDEFPEFDEDIHRQNTTKSGRNVIVNHHKVGYDNNAPHASYSGAYSSRRH